MVLAHHAGIAHDDFSAQKNGGGISVAEGFQLLQQSVGSPVHFGEVHLGVNGQRREQFHIFQLVGSDLAQALLKELQFGVGHGEAGRGGVPPVFDQEVAALVEGGGDVELGDAAGRAPAGLLPQFDHHAGAVEFVGQPLGDQTHDARQVVFGGHEEKSLLFANGQHLFSSSLQGVYGQPLAFAVCLFQFEGQASGLSG